MTGSMESTIIWVKAHGFKFKVLADNRIVWQTYYQTAEMVDDTITWHPLAYFDEVR